MARNILSNLERTFNIDKIPEDNIYKIQETWYTEFVKKQDDFIKQKCITHIKDTNKLIRIFQIDEDKLDYIFNLGLQEYLKERNNI